ncbi:uncharacterized protein LOC120332426 [Styela clava]
MSTFGVKCFVLLALYHSSVISGEKCFLPHGQPNLDFKKISETSWFVGLQTHDALATKVQCVKLDNFTTTITGFKFIAEEYGDGPVDVKYSVNFVRRGANGLYSFDKQKDEISLISSHRLIFQNDYTKKVHDTDNDELTGNGVVFWTDYKNYFALIECRNNGGWIIWVYFPSITPSVTNLVALYNKLHEIGVSTTFHISRCSKHVDLIDLENHIF